MRSFDEAIASRSFAVATSQGRYLSEVAALQRGNLDTDVMIKRITFRDLDAKATIAWRSREITVETPVSATASEVLHLLAAQSLPINPPEYAVGDDFPGEPGLPPLTLLTGLFLELGSNSSALVVYRFDVPPFTFESIDMDDRANAIVTLRDSVGRVYDFGFDWSAMSTPLVGSTYQIIDDIIDKSKS